MPIPSDQFHESSSARGLFKKAGCLTRSAHARQDVPFLGQGRRGFGARSVHGVREDGKGPTCLHEAAPAKAGNTAGGLFQQAQKIPDTLGGVDMLEQSFPERNPGC